MKRLNFFCLFFLFHTIIIPKINSQECIDLGTGINMDNSEYAFIDYFKGAGRWQVLGPEDHPIYRVEDLDEFKIVNGSYWHWDANWNGIQDNDAWSTWSGDLADCYVLYYDMMIDQDKLNENGYPLEVPFTIYKYKSKTEDPYQGIDLTQAITINNVTSRMYFPDGLPQEGWILKWEGQGTFEYEGIEVNDCDVPYTVTDPTSWTPDGSYAGQDVQFNSTDGGRAVVKHHYMVHGWVLNITYSDPSNPLRNFSFIYPGMEALHDAGEVFQPGYIERMSKFKTIRYMQYLSSNGLRARQRVPEHHPYFDSHWLSYMDWSERPKDNWYRVNEGNGGSYEYIVKLSNLTKTDPWINLPYATSPDYADSLVQYFLKRLDPDLTIYLEIGNELWNFGSGFTGFHWFGQMKTRHWPGLTDLEARGQQLNKVMAAITESAGTKGLERIERVYGAWPGYTYVNERVLENINVNNWDCFATTWYFNITHDNSEDNTCKDPISGDNYRTVLYNWHMVNPTNQTEFNQRYRDYILEEFRCKGSLAENSDFLIANYYNKYVVAYEGGNHTFYGCSNGPTGEELDGESQFSDPVYPLYNTDNSFINAVAVADESEEMGEVYTEIIDSLQSAGMKLANHLTFSKKSSCNGVWSLVQPRDLQDDIETLKLKYPKYRVFIARIDSANCDEVNVILPENNVGAGLSIRLDGLNDYIEGQTAYLPDESSNYTIESWIKPNYLNEEQVAVSFTNTGANNNYNVIKTRVDKKIVWEIGNNGVFDIKLVGPEIEAEKWNHVAVTKNGNRYTLYLNGYNVASGNYTMATATRNKYTIGGQYAIPVYNCPFNGEIDEVRLWDIARTEAEIREFMCKKVPVNTNLKSYYKFDKPDYTNYLVYDAATNSNTASLQNITITERSRYAISGAAIGDYSSYRYTANWDGVSVSLTHPDGDMAAVSSIGKGNPNGIHVYFVNGESYHNTPPEYYEGISDDRYFGVFVANGTEPSYDLDYIYAGNPDEKSGDEENKHRLLRRDNSAEEYWWHSGASIDQIANVLSIACKETERGEYTLAFRQKNNSVRPGAGRALLNPQPTTGNIKGTARYLNVNDYTITWWSKGAGEVFNLTEMLGGGEQRVAVNNNVGMSYKPPDGYRQDFSVPADRDKWAHYAITRKGSLISIYIDGVFQASEHVVGSYTIQEMHIFNDHDYAGGNYPGDVASISIDELTLWDIALDEATIRDWICKKITDEHPYECENLILYFNFEENQGMVIEDTRGSSDMVLETDSYGFDWVASGAAVGDESIHDYDSPADIIFTHNNGDYIEATRTSGGNSGIHLYRVDNMAPEPSAVDNASILSIDSSRYWGLYAVNAIETTSEFTITNYYEDNSSVNLPNETELRLLSRTDNTQDPWNANIGTTPNTTSHSLSLTGQERGEYILGGTSINTFSFNPPETPVFSTETATLNRSNICGNTTGLVYSVLSDPSVTTYSWDIPAELDGFSTKDSIFLNGSYSGTAPTVIIISVTAHNQFGESAPATYNITINPAPTTADAGPDQIILPPATSAIMDGNTVASGETGTWTIGFEGTASFLDENEPLTTASGLSSGNNYVIWTIDNGSCEPSTDTANIMLAPPPENIIMANGNPLPSNVCEGEILVLKVIPAEDQNPDSYIWTLPDGLNQVSTNGNEITVAVSDGFGGAIEVQSVYQGSASDAYVSGSVGIISQPAKPVFTDTPSTLCLNIDITLQVQFDATIDSFVWTLPYGIYPVEFRKSTSESILVQAIDTLSGYISVKSYNKGCTNSSAVDSFGFEVGIAPETPDIDLASDGGVADAFCRGEQALLWVDNYDPDVQYEWRWDINVELLEYFGDNNSGALFQMPYSNNSIWVKAVKGTGACASSEEFYYNGWARSETPPTQPIITITDPSGQNPLDLEVGVTYTFEVTGDMIDYYWNVPEGVTIEDAPNYKWDNINEITVNEDFAGFLEVWSIYMTGCASERARMSISTDGMVFPPEYESGNTSICQNTTLNITVTDVGADEYVWLLPNGTPFTTTIPLLNEVITSSMQGPLSFYAILGGIASSSSEVYIQIESTNFNAGSFVDVNNQPISIVEVCPETTTDVYHSDVLASDYIWSFNGSAILFDPKYEPGHEGDNDYISQNRTSFVDTMYILSYTDYRVIGDGTDGGWIYVDMINACGGADARDSIYYFLSDRLEIIVPEFENVPTEVCVGSSISYSIKEISGATQYIWSLPSGLEAAEIVTTVPEITVNVVAGTGGSIEVYAMGESCGGGISQVQTSDPITIEGMPLDFYFIDAPLAACPGDDISFSVNDIGASEYNWSLPEGLRSTIIDNDDTDDVIITGSWEEQERENLINGSAIIGYNSTLRSVEYTPDLPYTGTYRVSVSYYNYYRNINNVPVTINHASGSSTVSVNMYSSPPDGIWESVGEYEFNSGSSGSVIIQTQENVGDYSMADAVKFEILSIPDDTSMTFPVKEGQGGAVCVTVNSANCPSGYTICTDPINLGGTLDPPMFTYQENSVCESSEYEYRVSDIGADTYTWHLPTGMSIDGQTGVVTGLSRIETVTMDLDPGLVVHIGINGVITSCGVIGDTVYTNDISFDGTGCKLINPVFLPPVPDTVCGISNLLFTITSVENAESYQWVLPNGIEESGTGASGTITTTIPTITVTPLTTGTLGYITVTAIAPIAGIESSDPISTENPIVVLSLPSYIVSKTDLTTCTSNDGSLIINGLSATSTYNISYFDGTTTQEPGLLTSDLSGQIIISGLAAGIYSAIVIGVNSCNTTDPNTYTIVQGLPNVTFLPLADLCANDSAITLSGGFPLSGTYSGLGVSDGEFDPSVAGVGSNTIYYEYTEVPGCSNTATATITVNTLPSGTLISDDADNIICIGTAVEFTANDGDSYIFTLNGLEVETNTTGIYYNPNPIDGDLVGVEATLNNCIANYTETTISVVPLPTGTLSSSHDTICEGVNVSFTATGGSNYDFMVNGTSMSYSAQEIYVTSTLTDGDEISVQLIDDNECINMADNTIIIGIISAPKSGISGLTETCPGTEGVIYSATELGNVVYTWDITGESDYIKNSNTEIEIDWSTASEGIVNLTLMDTITSCDYDTSLIVVLIDNSAPEMLCPKNDKVEAVLENGIWHYVISDINTSWIPQVSENCSEETGYELSFSINGGMNLDIEDFISYELLNEHNEIIWTAKDHMNQASSCPPVEIIMTVNESVPKAFSPNGDGINDYWDMPFLQLYENCIVKVFNRHGSTVYESQPGYSDPWQGDSYGKVLAVDSYFYIITYGNGKEPTKGVITIIK